MSPNRTGVAHVHPLYVAVAHTRKLEVSPDAAQTGATLALDCKTREIPISGKRVKS